MKCYFCSMNNIVKASLTALILATSTTAVWADAAAEKVLGKARLAATVQMQDLEGYIRKEGKKYPLRLYMRKENIQFQY